MQDSTRPSPRPKIFWSVRLWLFTRGSKSKDKEEVQAKEAELFQQIGRLQMELEWLKKKSQLL